MGLGVPASVQAWPPGPVTVTRNRRLARARVMTAEEPPPSSAMAAAMRVGVGACAEEVTHAAQVAFALLAHVGGKEDRDGGGRGAWLQGGRQAEQGGQAGGVVACAGGKNAGVLLEGFGGGGGGEDGVEVGGEEDVGDWGWRARAMSRRQMRGVPPLRRQVRRLRSG
jgi:hypothetical protein